MQRADYRIVEYNYAKTAKAVPKTYSLHNKI